jgi:thiosulfate/3-mercaptopyruvate sulfurtransferase
MALGVPDWAWAQATPAGDHATGRAAWLIDAAELAGRHGDPDLRIVALTPADAFADAAIEGATAVDWPALELGSTDEDAVAKWTTRMRALVASLGIDASSDVVIYDEGSLFAARLLWVLTYLGHDATRILDGGLPAWREGGLAASVPATATPPAAPASLPTSGERPEALATLAEAEAALGRDEVVFVDARTPEEYATGHIPGAVNVNYPLNAEPDGPAYWKPTDALIDLYGSIGVTPDRRVIPYCSTGVRSAVTWFTLRMIGFPEVALFTGSWAEWSAHPELPVTTGVKP